MYDKESRREKNPDIEAARSHLRNAREEIGKTVEAWLPPEVVAHRKAARKEFLLAMRSFVNAALVRIDQETAGTSTPSGSNQEPNQD
ncbi:MAG: hypothetical protein M1281_18310 [Chloroflexi bacterium]|nr:hypothetical protein [Chloroflexota bacterium]